MWDLMTIIRDNNLAALESMMTPADVQMAQRPRPEVWALSELARKLQVGPPLLSELLKCFTNYEDIRKFIKLIREYLPEHETEILNERRNGRLYRFCYLFSKRYFPLPPLFHDNYLGDAVRALPVELMGMSYDGYHELVMRTGYLLMLSLVVYPYEGDERDQSDDDVPFDPFNPMARYSMEARLLGLAEGAGEKSTWQPKRSDITWVKNLVSTLADGGKWVAPMGFTVIKNDDHNIELRSAENTPEVRETVHRTVLIAEKAGIKVKVRIGKTALEKLGSGGRVPVVDAVRRLVGEDIIKLIPSEGWEPEELHQMTDGTPYDGLGDFADWACSQTGCIVLDNNYEDCEYIEGYGEPIFKWSRFNVDTLTNERPKVLELRQKIGTMVDWLEADPPNRFQELLEHLSVKSKKLKKNKPKGKKARHIYDPTEHWCPLHQEYQDEEDLDDIDEETAGGNEAGVQIREITPEEFIAGINP